MIGSDYECTVIGDVCLNSSGTFYNNFQLLCYISWSQNIIDRTLKNKESKHLETLSTNYFEHVVVLMPHNTVLDAIKQLGFVPMLPIPNL